MVEDKEEDEDEENEDSEDDEEEEEDEEQEMEEGDDEEEDQPIADKKEEKPIKIKEEIEGIEDNPFAMSREETLKIKLENANEKVYKWMAGIEPNKIGKTIGDWDKVSLLKMVEMADQEIREHPQKFIFIINIFNLFILE
jgi:hypothetical protein